MKKMSKMNTLHEIWFKNAQKMNELLDESIDVIITSPPYPMIEMWDYIFSELNPEIKNALNSHQGNLAFELMHRELDKVWNEVYRVLKSNRMACINIGDATRTINSSFQLYNSHSRIINYCLKLGFQVLPCIIWRKQTNAPNKFMGSGMLPPTAYITLEHEYILIMRKGNKRQFSSKKEKENRRESAYFWEERNLWFSDIWQNLKGEKQRLNLNELRKRSGAFPFELAYRLINMFSVKHDLVLDPFLGTGTTTLAAIAAERNSKGFEIENKLTKIIEKRISKAKKPINNYIEKRLKNHLNFIKEKKVSRKFKYYNNFHNFPIVTKQEQEIFIRYVKKIQEENKGKFKIEYSNKPAIIRKEKLTDFLER